MSVSRRIKSLKPICAVCKREVERMDMLQDRGTHDAHNIAVVYCHGKRRECRILDKHFYNSELHRGIAFLDELDRSLIEGTVQEIRQKFIGHQEKLDNESAR